MSAFCNYLSSFEMPNASILKLQIDRDRIALTTGEFEQLHLSGSSGFSVACTGKFYKRSMFLQFGQLHCNEQRSAASSRRM
jgi:hypothetical protein